jgi:tetratricopeptide (TPR) repeat protein
MILKKLLLLTKIFSLTTSIALASKTLAHGDIHDRIKDLGKKLAKSPSDTTLLIERGRLYLDAHHTQEAKTDFDKAIALEPQYYSAYYYLAQAHLADHKSNEALIAVEKFMLHQSEEAPRARGLALRGDIYRASGKPADAAIVYAESLALKKLDALPDEYVRLADTYLEADKNNTEKALAVLDQGIHQLGNLQALAQRAITIEQQSGRPEAALLRLNRLIKQNKPTAHLLLQKGKMLKNINELEQATRTFEEALAMIEQMPLARRDTPAMQSLREDITTQMNTIQK